MVNYLLRRRRERAWIGKLGVLIMSAYYAPYMVADWCYWMIMNVLWYGDCINSGTQSIKM